eukprot:TRINITY_DN6398_c0_g1_i1.p1 TRINITY_DN6398_c0_g1~~TRINITY_DN6398_c0_g1_i1.p1  ORF type:complete len:233 (+),score=42.75 TRINITY_DN6398_c0_g1_i1:186-884(+)
MDFRPLEDEAVKVNQSDVNESYNGGQIAPSDYSLYNRNPSCDDLGNFDISEIGLTVVLNEEEQNQNFVVVPLGDTRVAAPIDDCEFQQSNIRVKKKGRHCDLQLTKEGLRYAPDLAHKGLLRRVPRTIPLDDIIGVKQFIKGKKLHIIVHMTKRVEGGGLAACAGGKTKWRVVRRTKRFYTKAIREGQQFTANIEHLLYHLDTKRPRRLLVIINPIVERERLNRFAFRKDPC